MTMQQAINHANSWGCRCYVFRKGNNYDWDIRPQGTVVYVTIG